MCTHVLLKKEQDGMGRRQIDHRTRGLALQVWHPEFSSRTLIKVEEENQIYKVIHYLPKTYHAYHAHIHY